MITEIGSDKQEADVGKMLRDFVLVTHVNIPPDVLASLDDERKGYLVKNYLKQRWSNVSEKTERGTFLQEITTLINRHSVENGSDTPDWMLAEYLTDCLAAYEKAVRARDRWHGNSMRAWDDDAPTGTAEAAAHDVAERGDVRGSIDEMRADLESVGMRAKQAPPEARMKVHPGVKPTVIDDSKVSK